ncbi:MAG: hypothetical protein K9H64_03765 [Bacteroidales bacterium]|nr:hypothetical protein [Bacteroidales bacterium]MCF8454950.1 hypothetical protein [Bacteroidales bacterium]
MKKLTFLFFCFSVLHTLAQKDSLIETRDYSFVIQDSPSQLFTMRQFNESYLSGYRLFARGLNNVSKNDYLSTLIQLGIHTLFFMPLTHEEGHRSILTVNNIGSISQPYFNKYGAAYVKGVTDQALVDLRDNDLPTYIRLHTGGLESDYMLTKRMEEVASFGQDEFKNYRVEYYMRKLAIMQYYVLGLLKYEIDLDEEKDELERDIVGFDTYGAAKNLYRPTLGFYRYTRYKDLTGDEKKFVQRIGIRSFVNLLNPLMIGKGNFKRNGSTRFNVGMGYTMSPFGDFIDENIWVKYKDLKIGFYARQFQNKENWFPGFGLSLTDYPLSQKMSTTLSGHYWQQPVDFDFNTSHSFAGGAINWDISYFFPVAHKALSAFSVDLGLTYKTKGFLPEDLYLDEHFGARIGTTIRL